MGSQNCKQRKTVLWSVLHPFHYFPLMSLSSPSSIPSVFVILFCFLSFRKVISELPIWMYFRNFKQYIRAIFLLIFNQNIFSSIPQYPRTVLPKIHKYNHLKGHKTLWNTNHGEWLERRHRHSILSLEHSEQIWGLQRRLDPQLAFISLVTTTVS